MSNGLCGIIGEAFRKQLLINCDASKMRSSYYQSVDGDINESLLILPVLAGINDSDYAIVLKGKQNSSVFTQHDEQLLKKIAPYLVVSISNIEKHSTQNKTGQSNLNEHNCVQDLITIFDMILKNENPEKIVGNIMSKLEKVTTSDRCSLFIYNKKEKLLQTKYYSSLKDSITVPVDRGIVGATYRDSTIFNVPDSYEDPNFDSTIDLETGYKTKTLLSVPVKSIHDKNIGVIQLLNKLDGKPYSKLDIGFAKIYSQLSALILANYRNFTKLKKRTIQFHSLISDFHDNNIREEMKKIINLVQVSTNSEGSTLYLVDNILNVITTYVINGPKIPSTFPIPNSIAGHSIEIKKPILTNNPYREKVFNQSGDLNNGYKTKSLIAVPIFNTNNDDEPLAVLELVNKKVNNEYNQEDLKIAEKFAAFIGLRLENRKQKMIIEHGKAEVEMAKWIGEIERKSYIIPERLQIEPAKQNEILSINFFCVDWNGIGLFKVAFFAFNSFGLLEKYQIHNELFFVFLYTLKSYYNDVPYHNWIHAIDVLQYVVYQIHIAKLDSILTSNELLAICTAAICHDTNHSGLNNPYNQRAETPLGILYKDISVMEMHHCAMTIQILSQSNCNIFHAIPENDSIKIWHWIIQLILATDMAHHFKLLKNANDIMDQGPINLSNEMHRMMVMTMLIKIADISNVSRPFEIADRWCDILSEEFWRQGDLEKAHGWGVSSKLNDRDNVDKPNGQIGFYTFVCLPLYTAVARMLPELQVNADSVSANLEVWKEKAKEAEEEKAGVQSG
ncbi:3'5'-cyclic nucleotide phosphodiesterase family protein [Histomonas meleagridis]|uniref:3'5'-cyclic nucleotide phosphodiesterase family protein n=1 Tax=Histomonas meleagridis TaxID=135588 RepID=UPI00355AB01F|nr:3'5'-cyclic nucleotide phosphodiesterase family protein [Histomonas meleagridis]KAH0800806.1 3'5'-cyclic nucleotide phosphodiesterase family protein [Histomonas meleagridis]